MEMTTYLFIQMIVLICYASWVFYRVGYNKGYRKCEHDMEFDWEVNGEFVNEQQHKGE